MLWSVLFFLQILAMPFSHHFSAYAGQVEEAAGYLAALLDHIFPNPTSSAPAPGLVPSGTQCHSASRPCRGHPHGPGPGAELLCCPSDCTLLPQLLLEHKHCLRNLSTACTKIGICCHFPQLCFHMLVGTDGQPKVSFVGIRGSPLFRSVCSNIQTKPNKENELG